jgi:hypothetical protein
MVVRIPQDDFLFVENKKLHFAQKKIRDVGHKVDRLKPTTRMS